MAFSAMHGAAWSGKWMFTSAGAPVPGVSWNTIRMPSTVSVCPVRVMSRGRDQPDRAGGGGLPEARADLPARPGGCHTDGPPRLARTPTASDTRGSLR